MAECHPDRFNASKGLCDNCRLKRDYPKRKPKLQAWAKKNKTVIHDETQMSVSDAKKA